MKKTNLNILFTSVLTLFLCITNVFSQSESEKISDLISQKKTYNKENKNTIVYKIQLYNGNETEAYKIKQNFSLTFPEFTPEVVYDKPEWKTQVGKFKTRLDADRVALIIKEKFLGAIVLEDKI
ncbi:SPOR domain-containing protein [Lutibacter holmesii]|uniref:SPOR domain-containing protein n=1 Tax=Lutibacter holmesii TaxID=1137985 RepID=A0ABW3WM37_9FLAO